MKKLKRTLVCLLIAVVGQLVFTGCHTNTANGFGQDMQNAGEHIQEKSNE